MDSPWAFLSLSALALIGFVWLASQISQFGVRRFFRKIFIIVNPFLRLRQSPEQPARHRRPIRRISFEEFRHLLGQAPNNLVVLDLRTDAQWASFPVADAFVLPVAPNELMGILDRLPSNRSVVFYGVGAPWIATIERSPSMEGSAPFYFLDSSFGRMEVV